ncbi:HDOD domain-containing protein [Salinibacter altiplanensis]|uniref:HDOD domain-containing protein n=1 Tax=Salinibacter altiplanensis TaxID=1803181 RepID=UPI000C9FB754|nr:HDOD domain-containing protein [Salinibacter altiplanensis]
MSSNHSTENDQVNERPDGLEKDDLGDLLSGQGDVSFFVERLGRETASVLDEMLGVVEQLRAASADSEEPTAQLQEHGEGLRRIFRSITYLAHLSGDQGGPDPTEVDAVALAEELLEDGPLAAREDGLDLTLKAPSSPVEMITNQEALRQALGHLLATAIAVAPEEEGTLRVDEEDDAIAFHVEDMGADVSTEDLSALFEPFTHRKPKQDASSEGLGLGLPLARALSHQVKGTLDAESNPGEGRVFTLCVPRDVTSAARPESGEAVGQDAVRLLIVEDNDVTRRLLCRMLEDTYHVDIAEEAGQAIQQAEERAYDVFILDVNLKDRRTGVEVLQSVRKMEGYASTPAVACTAYALDDHREHFLRAGFNDVVAKPVTKREILEVVDRWLNGSALPETEAPEIVLSGIELPPIPTTLTEVASLASSPETPDVEALTEALQKDAVVSQWLVRHINSAYYSMRESIDTVERAVRYLGFQPVCNLILTKVIGESFSSADEPGGERVQQYIMRTSVLTAYIAREVSKEVGFEAPGVAYAGGIFAQIGRLALLEEEETYIDLWFEGPDRSGDFQGPPPQGQEILHFEEDYVQNGAAVGKACGVSDRLQAVLRGHHRPGRAREQYRPLVPIVALAFEVAHHAGGLEDDDPWGGPEALTSDLRDFQVIRHVVDGEPLSEGELISSVTGIVNDAQEFVGEVLDSA